MGRSLEDLGGAWGTGRSLGDGEKAWRLGQGAGPECPHHPTAVHGSRQEEVIDHRLTEREWAEEWKHLNNVSVQARGHGTTPTPGVPPSPRDSGAAGGGGRQAQCRLGFGLRLPASARPPLWAAPQNHPFSAPAEQLCLWERGALAWRWDPFNIVFGVISPLLPSWGGSPGRCGPQGRAQPRRLKGEPPAPVLEQTSPRAWSSLPPPVLGAFPGSGGRLSHCCRELAVASPRGQWAGPGPGCERSLAVAHPERPHPACVLTATARPQLLNCIMDMAEKTRRSLTVLRQCQEADREEINHWIRRYSDTEDAKKGPVPATARPLNSSVGAEGSQLGAC